MTKRKLFNQTAAALAALMFTAIANAQVAGEDDSWQFGAEIYLFASGIGGNSASGKDIDIDFDTLIDNLDMAFMGAFGARKGKWTLLADVIYFDVSASDSKSVSLSDRPGVKFGADIELKAWLVTPAVGYTVLETDTARLDLLAGARYLWLEADIKLDADAALISRSRKVSDSGSVLDAIVGVRGQYDLTPQWYLPYYLDVGAGDSELTWQAVAGVGYKFKKFDAVLGYRYVDWEFDDNDVFDDLNFSGPYLGAKFRF